MGDVVVGAIFAVAGLSSCCYRNWHCRRLLVWFRNSIGVDGLFDVLAANLQSKWRV